MNLDPIRIYIRIYNTAFDLLVCASISNTAMSHNPNFFRHEKCFQPFWNSTKQPASLLATTGPGGGWGGMGYLPFTGQLFPMIWLVDIIDILTIMISIVLSVTIFHIICCHTGTIRTTQAILLVFSTVNASIRWFIQPIKQF
jgi:hypothetical protein